MPDIRVGRYEKGESLNDEWAGWVEPSDLSWILFVPVVGKPVLYTERDPKTGAVVG